MKNTSRGINLHGGIEKIDPNISIPDTWAENSNRNIQDSQGELVREAKPIWTHQLNKILSAKWKNTFEVLSFKSRLLF